MKFFNIKKQKLFGVIETQQKLLEVLKSNIKKLETYIKYNQRTLSKLENALKSDIFKPQEREKKFNKL